MADGNDGTVQGTMNDLNSNLVPELGGWVWKLSVG